MTYCPDLQAGLRQYLNVASAERFCFRPIPRKLREAVNISQRVLAGHCSLPLEHISRHLTLEVLWTHLRFTFCGWTCDAENTLIELGAHPAMHAFETDGLLVRTAQSSEDGEVRLGFLITAAVARFASSDRSLRWFWWSTLLRLSCWRLRG